MEERGDFYGRVQKLYIEPFTVSLPAHIKSWFKFLNNHFRFNSAAEQFLVCTVGRLDAWPGASNVIPGGVNFTVDIRAEDAKLLQRASNQLSASVLAASRAHGVDAKVVALHAAEGVRCESCATYALQDAAHEVGAHESDAAIRFTPAAPLPERLPSEHVQRCVSRVRWQRMQRRLGRATGQARECSSDEGGETWVPINRKESDPRWSEYLDVTRSVPLLQSGAGHDAMAMAGVTDIAMLFVRCRGGVSHSPEEWVSPKDIAQATRVLATYLVGAVM